jgi:hypothetical protein
MTRISLLDGSLKLSIYVEESDRDFEDDICLCFEEDCDEEEKLFLADEVRMYITPEQAGLVVLELNRALENHRRTQQP